MKKKFIHMIINFMQKILYIEHLTHLKKFIRDHLPHGEE